MSYKIGQNILTSASEKTIINISEILAYENSPLIESSVLNDEVYFKDKFIEFEQEATPSQSYLINFKIRPFNKGEGPMRLRVKLIKGQVTSINSTNTKKIITSAEQLIFETTISENVQVKEGSRVMDKANDLISFSVIFTPNDTVYNYIKFEIVRDINYDFNIKRDNGTITPNDVEGVTFLGRILNLSEIEFFSLNNLLGSGSGNIFPSRLSKIAVSCKYPGMTFCLNGEQIRIGKSCRYELYNSIPITFLSFPQFLDDTEILIVDYCYTQE